MRKTVTLVLGMFLLLNSTAFALSTDELTKAILSVHVDLKQERISSKYWEDTLLLFVEDYRNLAEITKTRQTLSKLSDKALADAGLRCKETVEQLAERTWFGRRKIAKQVRKEIDDKIFEKGGQKLEARRLVLKYRRALDRLLEHAEYGYRVRLIILAGEWSRRRMTNPKQS